MSDKNSHSIRNSVVAGLIVAAILWIAPPARSIALAVLRSVWGALVSAWQWLWASHAGPGWLWVLVLASPFVLLALLRIGRALRQPDPPYLSYVEDHIHGVKWHWQWSDSGVIGLWGFCPRCEMRLVYTEYRYDRTDFICENCSHAVVWSCHGGGQVDYALGQIQREIERKVKTNQFPRRNENG